MTTDDLATWISDPANMPDPDDTAAIQAWSEAAAMRLMPNLIQELDALAGIQIIHAIAFGFCAGAAKAGTMESK